MSRVTRYRAQITAQMDQLQSMMEDNLHLRKKNLVQNHIDAITYKWHFVSEEDRDYIQCAQTALEEGWEWNVDTQ